MRPSTLRRGALLVVLALLIGLTSACGALPGLGGRAPMRVTALFTSSSGLFVGNDVGILGVTVGHVTAIEPDGPQVRVEMEIDTDHKIPADVGAVVVARSVATDRYVELTPVYSGGPVLATGAVIDRDRTRTPVEFDQVLGALDEFATGISGSKRTTKAVQRFIDAGQKAFGGRGQALNDTLGSLAGATNVVASQRKQIVAALKALDDLVASVAANRDTIDEFVQQVSGATTQLAGERSNLQSALDALQRAVTEIARFAVDNREDLVSTVKGAGSVISSITAKQRQLEEILRVMPTALQNLQRTTVGDRLVVRLSPSALVNLGDLLGDVCKRTPLDPACKALSSLLGSVVGGLGGILSGLLGPGTGGGLLP
ncbi:MCE family protein [Nocardioides sp. TRM66260-LWL]|uniref:MCE family protein n=1 Tax=Nocardioides sp. TRM66260-LWL TaxID=2874478 RepID=UPI001CC46CE4|nr:MCE family protein [Nocardioides sp. TRM66260-LWL]MBZ5736289.1 MCE family protein [Nocardioides sp. TRM66260-LWL]